jgi:zinc transporter 11
MLADWSPIGQAALGTLFTWFLTAVGGLCVVLMPLVTSSASAERKILDACLGFAAGVMLAASYWSLLEPAVEMAAANPTYGEHYAWVPPAVGFLAGALFLALCDWLLERLGVSDVDSLLVNEGLHVHAKNDDDDDDDDAVERGDDTAPVRYLANDPLRQRRPHGGSAVAAPVVISDAARRRKIEEHKRVMLLVLAVTVHNLPEGLAVGVGFASVGKAAGATFERARNLAIGIGLQNFPEGFAVSMPLYRHGQPLWKCVFYGQLSGMVEPIGGILGAWAVVHVEPLLPYALAFAAGAMIFVVVDSIVPEIVASGNRSVGSWGVVAGFLVMMVMDLSL